MGPKSELIITGYLEVDVVAMIVKKIWERLKFLEKEKYFQDYLLFSQHYGNIDIPVPIIFTRKRE